MVVWYSDHHWNTGPVFKWWSEYWSKFSPVFKWHTNIEPLGHQTTFNHSNTRLVWRSDPLYLGRYCTSTCPSFVQSGGTELTISSMVSFDKSSSNFWAFCRAISSGFSCGIIGPIKVGPATAVAEDLFDFDFLLDDLSAWWCVVDFVLAL